MRICWSEISYGKTLIILLLGSIFPFYANSQVNELAKLLRVNHAHMALSFNRYDYSQYNKLMHHDKIVIDQENSDVTLKGSKWKISVSTKKSDSNACYLIVKAVCLAGNLPDASLSVDINFQKWDKENYVLLPAVAYNGNRYQWRKLRYSPKLYEVQDIGQDKPIILTDVPKLNESDGISQIQERSGSMSLPSIGFRSNLDSSGFWLVSTQRNNYGDYGLGIKESRDRKNATISVTSPLVREIYSYRNTDAHSPSLDQPANFKAGDTVIFSLRLYNFKAPAIQSVFDKYAAIRTSEPVSPPVDKLSFDQGFKIIAEKFNKYNFVPKFGYYAVGLRENYMQDWQIGWTGGMISTYPLLVKGDAQTKENVIRNFNWLFPNGISPSGFYWDAGKDGNIWYGGDIRKPQTINWHLIRKSGDAVYYILKQFEVMKSQGIPVKPEWENGNKVVCDAFIKLWEENHQIGQFIDSQTGRIEVGGSTSGAIVPAALALASVYYHNPKYLKVAAEIGDYFNLNYTMKGIPCGGPGDALQNFDSESSYALIESYITLYELTKNKKWLDIAESAAKQFSTWVVAYNYQFPENSDFYKLGIKSAGSVYANTQNKHAAPGICTYSGWALMKLSDYTQNPFYLNLLHEIAHSIMQYVPFKERPIGNMKDGFVSERVNLSDWEGEDRIGAILPISTWAESSAMLTAIEIPGIYINLQNHTIKVFDQITCKWIKDNSSNLKIQIQNPYKTAIEVTVYVSDANNLAKKPDLFFPQYRSIKLKAGENRMIAINNMIKN